MDEPYAYKYIIYVSADITPRACTRYILKEIGSVVVVVIHKYLASNQALGFGKLIRE